MKKVLRGKTEYFVCPLPKNLSFHSPFQFAQLLSGVSPPGRANQVHQDGLRRRIVLKQVKYLLQWSDSDKSTSFSWSVFGVLDQFTVTRKRRADTSLLHGPRIKKPLRTCKQATTSQPPASEKSGRFPNSSSRVLINVNWTENGAGENDWLLLCSSMALV